ncbi:MAG: hypothetical protein ACYDDS_12525 [Candidatus Sulfotelmatobacter sp.]
MSPLDPDLARALGKMMRADLDVWSNWWFWSLVGSTIVVAIGIFCEAPEIWREVGLGHKTVARIRTFWYVRVRKRDLKGGERLCPELITTNERHRRWIARAGFVGWTLVALGVGGEGIGEYFLNDAETNLRAFDQTVLIETQQSANSAAMASSLANTFSDKAVAASSNSLTLAKGARKEADSFEGDIKTAKQQAVDAESHLAEALRQAADARKELDLLKTPRTLTDTSALVSALKPFKGTRYIFFGLFGDEESTLLLRQIDGVLQSAEWERVQPPSPFPPAFTISIGNISIAVSHRIDTGVKITVESTESVASLQSLPLDKSPPYIQAATALRGNLIPRIFPPQNGIADAIGVLSGNEPFVLITVGKKP